MAAIRPIISFQANQNPTFESGRIDEQKKEDIKEGVVAGGAAGAGYTAAKGGAFKQFKSVSGQAARTSGNIRRGQDIVRETRQVLTAPVAEARGLWPKFKANCKFYQTKFFEKISAIKTSRYIKPLLENKVVKMGCGVVGGAFAACILITGVGTLYSNTTRLVDHYAPKVAEDVNTITDTYAKKEDE